ncbi:GntR family transcriptional regulator [Halothiobacillus sp.]|uniref:GntR family transcriptional regulator n=1 Tax=Halothiobacillus sp. TaxID=1891311 RepID=UPI0026142EF2|nr:GntR family transcriptional regulator [Halothiobacillus sp.]
MTKTEEICRALRDEILHGRLTSGEALRQDAIAERFGVSHIPVREALRQLAAEGLAEIRSHQGARVNSLSVSEARQLLEIRCILETQAIRWALEKGASAEDVQRAAAVLDEAEDVADIDCWMRQNWLFHSSLYRAAERPRLFAMIESVDTQIDRFIRVLISTQTDYRQQADLEHRAILAAYRVGSEAAVCVLLEQHMTETKRRLEILLPQ